MRVSLIIPALNEAGSLGPLLAEVPAGLIHEVIVVNNGSTDRTAEVAQAAGAVVIDEPRRGYGFACAAGSAVAEGDVVAFIDGDGSFAPEELRNLLPPIIQGKADLVLGSRMRGNRVDMPSHQRFGNLLFVWLLRQRFRLKLTDLGPFRAIRRELLMALDMRERTFGWPLEMIIKTARHRKRIVEVPISYYPRTAGRSKVGGTLRGSILTAYRFFHVMLRYSF
jgi:glycosyltransferase involved in cell wall biosynthesis